MSITQYFDNEDLPLPLDWHPDWLPPYSLYDISALDSMFVSRTSGAYFPHAGSPVGLVFDASKDIKLGEELHSPNFSVGTYDNDLGRWVLTRPLTGSPTNYNTRVNMVTGRAYSITFKGYADGGEVPHFSDFKGSSGGLSISAPQLEIKESGQEISFIYVSSGNNTLHFFGGSSNNGNTWGFSDVSIREVVGVPIHSLTDAARPTLVRMPATGRRNLFTYSEDFNNAIWFKNNANDYTFGKPDPFGGNSAIWWKPVFATDPGGALRSAAMYQGTVRAAQNSRYSLYVKPVNPVSKYPIVPPDNMPVLDRDVFMMIRHQDNGQITFNLRTMSVHSTSLGVVNTGIQDIGDGWYRVWYTAKGETVGNGNTWLMFGNRPAANFDPYPDGTEEVHIYGMMFEIGDEVDLDAPPTPYQKVTNAFDVSEEGVPDVWSLLFDLWGSALTATLPKAINGNIVIAGTKGSVIEPINYSAGSTFSLGATTYTEGKIGLLSAIGGVVGVALIDRVLTPLDKKVIIDYYRTKGAKGLLQTTGPELLPNGDFSLFNSTEEMFAAGWISTQKGTGITKLENGRLVCLNVGAGGVNAGGACYPIDCVAGESFEIKFTLVAAAGNPAKRVIVTNNTNRPGTGDLLNSVGTGTGSYTVYYTSPDTGRKYLHFYNQDTDGVRGEWDDISIRKLIALEN